MISMGLYINMFCWITCYKYKTTGISGHLCHGLRIFVGTFLNVCFYPMDWYPMDWYPMDWYPMDWWTWTILGTKMGKPGDTIMIKWSSVRVTQFWTPGESAYKLRESLGFANTQKKHIIATMSLIYCMRAPFDVFMCQNSKVHSSSYR